MAQDFPAQFPLNANDTARNDTDLRVVTPAAIQGLNRKVNAKDKEIQPLKRELEQLQQVVNKPANALEVLSPVNTLRCRRAISTNRGLNIFQAGSLVALFRSVIVSIGATLF